MPSGNYDRRIECGYCHEKVCKQFFDNHLQAKHGTTRYFYLLDKYDIDEAPVCPICGNMCKIKGFEFLQTCGDITCRNRLVNQRSMEHGTNAIGNMTPEEHYIRGIEEQQKRREEGTPAFINCNSETSKKAMVTKRETGVLCVSADKISSLYFILFPSIHKCKISKSRDLKQRISQFFNSGLEPSEILFVDMDEVTATQLEYTFHQNYKDKRQDLDSSIDEGNFYRVGRHEFYSEDVFYSATDDIEGMGYTLQSF